MELWEACRRFVAKKAFGRSRAGSRVPLDDLIQAGFLAVMDAAERYDPGNENASFFALLDFTLKTRWAEEAGTRTTRRDALRGAYSLDVEIYQDDPDSPTLADAIPDESAALAFMGVDYSDFLVYCRGIIECALETVSETQATAIRLYYLEGFTHEDAALICGNSTGQATQAAVKSGFYLLRRGSFSKRLRECLEAFEDFHNYAAAAHSQGIGGFMRYGMSATEAAALVSVPE